MESIDVYHSTAVILDELSESSDEEDYSYLSYMMRGSNMIQSVKVSPKILQTSSMEEAMSMLLAIRPGTDIADLCVLAQIST